MPFAAPLVGPEHVSLLLEKMKDLVEVSGLSRLSPFALLAPQLRTQSTCTLLLLAHRIFVTMRRTDLFV